MDINKGVCTHHGCLEKKTPQQRQKMGTPQGGGDPPG